MLEGNAGTLVMATKTMRRRTFRVEPANGRTCEMQERPRDRHIRQPPLKKVCLSDETRAKSKGRGAHRTGYSRKPFSIIKGVRLWTFQHAGVITSPAVRDFKRMNKRWWMGSNLRFCA